MRRSRGRRVTLLVHTARITYAGPDRLDITRKSGDATFAPSWLLLRPMLDARRQSGSYVWLWPRYVSDYTAEMRVSYREHRAAWDGLLARAEVTLVCYCTDPAHCHRTVLAGILGKLGATVMGERERPDQWLRDKLDGLNDQQLDELETLIEAELGQRRGTLP